MLWIIFGIVIAATIIVALNLPSDPENWKKCQFCNKRLKAESVKCRYCKRLLIEYGEDDGH